MEKIALFLVEMERKNISLYFSGSGFFLFLHFHKAFTLCKSLRELKCQKIIFTVMFLFLRWKVFFLFFCYSQLCFFATDFFLGLWKILFCLLAKIISVSGIGFFDTALVFYSLAEWEDGTLRRLLSLIKKINFG